MKKIFALMLVVCMVLCMFAGCKNNNEDEYEQNNQNNQFQEAGSGTVATQPQNQETEPEATEPEVTEPEPVVYDSFFYFYDYEAGDYVYSDVATYQAVTGTECELSSLDFRFLEEDYEYTVTGYDERYGVFIYDFNQDEFNLYVSYLEYRGFERVNTESYSQGTSYFYMNEETGFIFDMFVAQGNSFIAIEPYMNGMIE